MEGKKRVCIIERGRNGFGFILCCENQTTDTYVLHVLNSSPASAANLKPGDRIIEINHFNVEKVQHENVVERLQGLHSVRLVVCHCSTAERYFKQPGNGMTVKPLDAYNQSLRPKLITVKKSGKGFDFVLQTVGKSRKTGLGKQRQQLKGITGHFASTVQIGGVAYKAGLRQGHRLIEINGIDIEEESHAYVIATMKSSHSVQLLVVDEDTDDFFRRHGVSPTSKHLTGELEFGIIPDSLHAQQNNVFGPRKKINSQFPSLLSSHTKLPGFKNFGIQSSRNSVGISTMAISTPDLSNVGKQKSTIQYGGTGDDLSIFDRLARRRRTDKSKKEIKRHLSKLQKKSPSFNYHQIRLPTSRRLYDDTNISDFESSSTWTTSSTEVRSRITRSSDCDFSSSPILKPQTMKHREKSFQTPDYDSPPPDYESPEELARIEYKVDLQTLKERVRRKSNQSRHGVVRAKSKLSDYSLAHLYVNSY